jgi:ABC-2 type transport system ATP-binding protein
VLRDVSFAVPPGEVHGVVGRNGAGKTTLLNAVAGLLSADAGTCTVGGTRADLATVAYLPVETHLYSHITGREYLRIFDEAPRRGLRELVSHWRHGGRSRAESAAWEDAWAEAFELPLDALVNTYSTGMRRKLALVGAFRLDRPLVVLDEPTNGLDLEANQVLARIVRAVADRGASVVITSHILEALEAACHAVHVIEGGRLAGSFRRHEFPTLRRHLEGDVDRRVSALEGLIGRAAE